MAILNRRFTTRAILALLLGSLGGCATGPGGVRLLNEGSAQLGLAHCPARPSCVSSSDAGEIHRIAPLKFEGDGAAALQRVRKILVGMPRTKIIDIDDHYLHATQASAVFRFADDVEFLLDAGNSEFQVRSCARLGFYDFGVNRRRIEQIRSALSPR
ncbi:MAG: DUF1499 domain-containing protein [Dokdonella sp.]